MINASEFAKKAKRDTITAKKVRVEGTKKFINADTGEIEEMMVTTIEERDFNFTKVWLQSFLPQLRLIGNKKIDVCMWIIEHLNRDNQLIATYRQVSEATGVSLDTVTKTMKCLVDSNFMRREFSGCYRINPDILFKGGKQGRQNALFEFRTASGNNNASTSADLKVRRDDILKNISILQKQVTKLDEQIKFEDTEDEVAEIHKAESRKKPRSKAKKEEASVPEPDEEDLPFKDEIDFEEA